MERLLASFKLMLNQQAGAFVESAGQRPLLISYSDDGTPVSKAGYTLQYSEPTGHKASRRGNQGVEVLVQQVFLRFIEPTGECKSRCLLREPVALTYGKKGDAIFACGRDLYPTVREQGHSGIIVRHCCAIPS